MANANERAKSIAGHFALSMMKRPKFQSGGGVTGPLLGLDGGRTDSLPISVPEGSYVIPSDIVSGIPSAQGNSLAGHNALAKLFASLPLSPDEAPYGAPSPNLPKGRTMPGLVSEHRLMDKALAKGGNAGKEEKEGNGHVPILAAAGEFVVKPETMKHKFDA